MNGDLVMKALRDLKKPATLTAIINHLEYKHNFVKSSIKDFVIKCLKDGTSLGIFKREGTKYSIETKNRINKIFNKYVEDFVENLNETKTRQSRAPSNNKSIRHKTRSQSNSKVKNSRSRSKLKK